MAKLIVRKNSIIVRGTYDIKIPMKDITEYSKFYGGYYVQLKDGTYILFNEKSEPVITFKKPKTLISK